MKYLILVSTTILLGFVQVKASSLNQMSFEVVEIEPIEPRIDVINNNSFFILNLKNEGIVINYGDRVELVFGYGINNKIDVYNISNSNSKIFTNKNELAAFIDPEHLKCFENKKLRKVIIYSGSKKKVVKIKLPANQLQTK